MTGNGLPGVFDFDFGQEELYLYASFFGGTFAESSKTQNAHQRSPCHSRDRRHFASVSHLAPMLKTLRQCSWYRMPCTPAIWQGSPRINEMSKPQSTRSALKDRLDGLTSSINRVNKTACRHTPIGDMQVNMFRRLSNPSVYSTTCMRLHQLAFALNPSTIYPLGARPASRTIFALLDRLATHSPQYQSRLHLWKKSFIMLQHAQMSHAFQSTATGVSVIIDNLQRARHTDIVQGRTYQISKLPELDYAINVKIFREILELDDEDEQYFTRSLVCDYFTLAQRTFAEMDACLSVHDSNLLL